MGAREPSVAVEACYPSLALDGGRDASRVFARSSCLPLESVCARQRRRRRPEVSGQRVAEDRAGSKGRASAPAAPDGNQNMHHC